MTNNKSVNLSLTGSKQNAIYNLTDKPSQSVGQTLSDIWFLVCGGVSHAATKRQYKYQKELQELHQDLIAGISNIPPDKQIEPNLQKVGPAIQNLQCCIEEKELRELFKNLILASLNKDTAEQVHPSFADTIKRMSPRDASNLASFGNVANTAIAEYRLNIGSNNFTTILPYVFLHNKKYTDLHNQSASICMLETLGLVKVDFSAWFNDSSYTEFYKTEEYKAHKEMAQMANASAENLPTDIPAEIKHHLQQKQSVEVRKGIITLTPIGSMLKDLCPKDI